MLNLDTHILLFALSDELSKREKHLLSTNQWSISSIVLWEITKLYQLGRIEINLTDKEFMRIINGITIWPLSLQICLRIKKLDFRSDPADEIICATSLEMNIPLLTRDSKVLKSKVVPLAD